MELAPGSTLGNYEIVARLGEGGMGLVYRARDHRLHRDVAIKVVPQRLANDSEQISRFVREARAASALNHPNILTIHDFDEESKPPYLVMELVDGRTLHEVMGAEPLTEVEVRRIGGQLADGLAKAHEAGIVHRDLKPANVMLTRDGFVKILDFGLAKRVPGAGSPPAPASEEATVIAQDGITEGGITEDGITEDGITEDGPAADGSGGPVASVDASLITEPGVVLGTVGYMSPEQAQGHELDDRSDQFSLGVMLYEMATGRRPFAKPTPIGTLAAILSAEPTSASTLNPALSAELTRLIARLLEKSPERRFTSTREVAAALRSPTQELELTQRLPSSSGSPVQTPAAPSAPTRSLQVRASRRGPWLAAVAVGAALLMLFGWWLVDRLDQRAEERRQLRWAREQAMPQLRDLMAADDFTAAWSLARQIEPILGADPELLTLKTDSEYLLTLNTDPPGAEVDVRDYDRVDGPWISLGKTPIERRSVPRDYLFWRFRLASHGDLEFPAHPMMSLRPKLYPLDEAPAGMVRVSSGRHQPPGRPPMAFEAFWIDRFEVKNREFQQFVDAGGYANPEFWVEPFIRGEITLDGQQAVSTFVDRTGQPGPATWELGAYPEGGGEQPVRGVSWFEAAAYARWAGKSLPTVHHWRHAAGLGQTMFANRLLQSNIGRPNAGPLETSGASDPFGTYDMAGNVKEWCSNPSGTLRFTLGGSWQEPRYLFAEANIQSPFERSDQQGFRCVRYDRPPAPELLEPVELLVADFSDVEPVDDQVFEAYRSFYAYDAVDDPAELNVVQVETTVKERFWRKEIVTYDAPYGGERIPLHLFLPWSAEPPYQTVVFFPASFALIIPSSEFLDTTFAEFIARSGRALAYPIYQRTYERRQEAPLAGVRARRDLIIEWAKDVQRTVDYLESRDDIDGDKIAFYGLSLGANYGPIFTAVEQRFKASLLIGGGLGTPLLGFPPEANPLHFAPRSTQPTLMLNGRYDFNYPIDTSVEPLFELLGAGPESKSLQILESAHIPPRNEAFRLALAWLDVHLGPTTRESPRRP